MEHSEGSTRVAARDRDWNLGVWILPFGNIWMLKLTYGGLFDMGMETDLRGPNSEEGKFDWFFLGKEKGGEAKTHF